MEKFFVSEMPSGITLLGQQMDQVSSAAMILAVRAGAAYDPVGSEGSAAVLAEWVLRGAGDRNTRQLNDALDSLGCHHSETIRSEHLVFSASQLGRNLSEVLRIYADVFRRPRLENETFSPSRALTLQDLASLEDEPAKKCNMLLREKFYPYPLGRCVYGNPESLQALTTGAARSHARERLNPCGAILAVAGNINWESFRSQAEEHLADFTGANLEPPKTTPAHPGVTYIQKDSAQTHIALGQRSVTIDSDHYYSARIAETILSGGMSSRLFTEVREKRGLAYHVSARYHTLKHHAGLFTYAGTTPEKAQETFDVTVGELKRLAEGVTKEEMEIARTQLKSALIMHGESTGSRANALVSDWYHLHRLRTLCELSDAIDKVTVDDVLGYLSEYPPRDFTVLMIGPAPVETGAIGE